MPTDSTIFLRLVLSDCLPHNMEGHNSQQYTTIYREEYISPCLSSSIEMQGSAPTSFYIHAAVEKSRDQCIGSKITSSLSKAVLFGWKQQVGMWTESAPNAWLTHTHSINSECMSILLDWQDHVGSSSNDVTVTGTGWIVQYYRYIYVGHHLQSSMRLKMHPSNLLYQIWLTQHINMIS